MKSGRFREFINSRRFRELVDFAFIAFAVFGLVFAIFILIAGYFVATARGDDAPAAIAPPATTLADTDDAPAAPPAPPYPLVTSRIDTIALAHWTCNNCEHNQFLFYDFVQGDWWKIDSRWAIDEMSLSAGPDNEGRPAWFLEWRDLPDDCDRVVVAKCFVETWGEDPTAEEDGRIWWRRLLCQGLEKPK